MKFSEYISNHHLFTTDEITSACDSPASVKQQLWQAVKSGKVERVRRGVYVSFAGRFQGSTPDPFSVVYGCDHDAVFCFHSALAAHGVEHNISFQCDFMSNEVKAPFEFREIRYVPHKMNCRMFTSRIRIDGGIRVLCTSKEQTIVDCMDKPWLAGGPEEVVRSLTLFAFIDEGELVEIMRQREEPSKARLGWLLSEMRDKWHVSEETLKALRRSLGKGPYRFGRPRSGNSGWSAEWKLLLPGPNTEVQSWISR